jgi:excisionase family DNA binding protein
VPDAEAWVTLQEIADHLKISRDTVSRWIERKGMPAHKAGRVWRFKVSEVDQWIASGSAADTHESEAEK